MELLPLLTSDLTAWLNSGSQPQICTTDVLPSDYESTRKTWLDSPEHHWYLLDGSRMKDWRETYEQFTKIMNFPDYFGNNLNALSECLTELDGLGFVVEIRECDKLLSNAPPDSLNAFIDTLKAVAFELSAAVTEGTAWDRSARPFKVILVTGICGTGWFEAPDSHF